MTAVRIFVVAFHLGVQDFGRTWTVRSWAFGWMLRILTNAAMWVMLGRLLGDPERLQFLIVGNGVMAGPQATAWALGGTQMDRRDGTYPLQVIAPASLLPALVGRTSVWLINAFGTAFVTFVVLGCAFDLHITPGVAVLLAPVLILVCLSSYGFMLCIGTLTTWVPTAGSALMGISLALLMALTGVAVPVSFWPPPVQVAANILPVTHGLGAIRLLFAHGPPSEIWRGVALEVVVGAAWFAIAMAVTDRIASTGRRNGSIDFA